MRLVIIDDHALIRKGVSMVLSIEDDFDIIGEASDLKSGLKLINETKPDMAIIDLRLGKDNGVDLIEKVDKSKMDCKFVILTTSSDEEDFRRAEAQDVDGYILKDALPEEIIYAIRLIARGRKYYDPSVIESVMKAQEEIGATLDELTLREKDVLVDLGKGLSNTDIAKHLYITEHTVKKHVSQIFNKLDLNDRTQAALYAVSKGLVKSSFTPNACLVVKGKG